MARRRPGGLTAEAFNQQHEVGTAFRYYPVAGRADFTETRTRSEAWTLGGGEPVVLHGYYFDEREAYEHARRLDAGCAPSMEHHVERLNPGGDDA